MSKRLWAFLPVGILAAAVLIFFNKMAFTNLILGRGDTLLYFYPYWHAAADALQAGRVPLWNPDLFMGAPFIANSQVGFFYPLNWPVWLLLPTPYAVSASIVLHLFIAAVGTYLAGRRQLGLGPWAAVLAALLFALGGYLTAQVEHVNQLQGLGWLPWFFAVWPVARTGGWRQSVKSAIPLGVLFALQLLAGHTQSVFITGVGVGIWLIGKSYFGEGGRFDQSPNTLGFRHTGKEITGEVKGYTRLFYTLSKRFSFGILPLVLGGLIALSIAAVQLLPTLELTQQSSRQGGLPLNDVLSFSLHPLLLSRALLPSYGQSVFSEYAAILPLTALLLAFIGVWQWRKMPQIRPFIILMFLGLFLALGQFNILYYLLGNLPGFSFFRVPARWLVLYGFGAAMLAGYGWEIVRRDWADEWQRRVGRPLKVGAIILFLLMIWAALSVMLARVIPVGPEAPVEQLSALTVIGWLAELGAVYLFVSRLKVDSEGKRHPPGGLNPPGGFAVPLPALAIVVLFLGSRSLPYNNLTTPEAYFDLRPSITRIQAAEQPGEPKPRFLSLSNIFFDPGDLAEIETIYDGYLSDEAFYDYTIAIKQKEIIAPNLPLAYGHSSIDGFDGGVLPLRNYTELMTLVLPEGVETTDGRLREHLDTVPDARWLDLFGARFIITDKVGDTWREIEPGQSVYFDLQLPQTLEPDEHSAVAHIPNFDPTALFLIASGTGEVNLTTPEGQSYHMKPELVGDDLWRVGLPVRTSEEIRSIELIALSDSWQINGLTLVNEAEGTFQSLVLGNYRLIHSGDVKIYENLDVLPRAFIVPQWSYSFDVSKSVESLGTANFDPRETAVIVNTDQDIHAVFTTEEGQVQISSYEPERIELNVTGSGLLVLTEANYPGWRATIDGQEVEIQQTNGLFQGVVIPDGDGEREVVFVFQPGSFRNGKVVSLISLGFVLVSWFFVRKRQAS